MLLTILMTTILTTADVRIPDQAIPLNHGYEEQCVGPDNTRVVRRVLYPGDGGCPLTLQLQYVHGRHRRHFSGHDSDSYIVLAEIPVNHSVRVKKTRWRGQTLITVTIPEMIVLERPMRGHRWRHRVTQRILFQEPCREDIRAVMYDHNGRRLYEVRIE